MTIPLNGNPFGKSTEDLESDYLRVISEKSSLESAVENLHEEVGEIRGKNEAEINLLFSRIRQYFCSNGCKDEYCIGKSRVSSLGDLEKNYLSQNMTSGDKLNVILYCLDNHIRNLGAKKS